MSDPKCPACGSNVSSPRFARPRAKLGRGSCSCSILALCEEVRSWDR